MRKFFVPLVLILTLTACNLIAYGRYAYTPKSVGEIPASINHNAKYGDFYFIQIARVDKQPVKAELEEMEWGKLTLPRADFRINLSPGTRNLTVWLRYKATETDFTFPLNVTPSENYSLEVTDSEILVKQSNGSIVFSTKFVVKDRGENLNKINM